MKPTVSVCKAAEATDLLGMPLPGQCHAACVHARPRRGGGPAIRRSGQGMALARPDPLLECKHGGFHRLVTFLCCAVLRRGALPCGCACEISGSGGSHRRLRLDHADDALRAVGRSDLCKAAMQTHRTPAHTRLHAHALPYRIPLKHAKLGPLPLRHSHLGTPT